MGETSRTKEHYFGELEKKIFSGSIIDIGCGPDPVYPNARRFDMEDGDANRISEYIKEEFDAVFSSHCLEDIEDPYQTIFDWWKLVKDGGYLYITVPDEDLYEQGHYPSIYNLGHKHTFTIQKLESWSPVSINVTDIVKILSKAKIVKIELQDKSYDYESARKNPNVHAVGFYQICFVLQKINKPITYKKISAHN